MKYLLPALLALLPLALAKGPNKPGRFKYSCTSQDNCDEERIDKWLLQACQGIGGKELTNWGPTFTSRGKVVGGKATCLCARGQTSPHTYQISGDYPPGTATLEFDTTGIDADYWCQTHG